MAQKDSFDKIVESYFSAITAEEFQYKKKIYRPLPLHVSPSFFFDFQCKMGCAGCCTRFTLDYLPSEVLPDVAEMESRMVDFNGRKFPMQTYFHADQKDKHYCNFVNQSNGACGIHGKHPFSCDFETLRFLNFENHAWLGVRPYGRGWNMLRIDGQRGAMCHFPKVTNDKALDDGIRKLERLEAWADYFRIRTYLPNIIRWAKTGPHIEPLVVSVAVDGTIFSNSRG